jgi:hypothetical protein
VYTDYGTSTYYVYTDYGTTAYYVYTDYGTTAYYVCTDYGTTAYYVYTDYGTSAPPYRVICCLEMRDHILVCRHVVNKREFSLRYFFHNVHCHYVVVMAITVTFVTQIMLCDKYIATAP